MKRTYVKITIEAPSYEAKATADHLGKDKKYEVLNRSGTYPCAGTSNVRIYLRIIKKNQPGSHHDVGPDRKHAKNRKHRKTDYKALMQPMYR